MCVTLGEPQGELGKMIGTQKLSQEREKVLLCSKPFDEDSLVRVDTNLFHSRRRVRVIVCVFCVCVCVLCVCVCVVCFTAGARAGEIG